MRSLFSSVNSVEDLITRGRWFEPSAQPIVFLRIDDSHCHRVHSLTVSVMVMWGSSQWFVLQEITPSSMSASRFKYNTQQLCWGEFSLAHWLWYWLFDQAFLVQILSRSYISVMHLLICFFVMNFVRKIWKEYCPEDWFEELQERMDRCTGFCNITEIMFKTAQTSCSQSVIYESYGKSHKRLYHFHVF